MSNLITTPCIIPLCLPKFGKSKYIDTSTLIDICCDKETQNLEVFYTLDGTKPQPYVEIVQGSKTHKFAAPFSLPPGKVTVKAVTAHSLMSGVVSSIVTKTFHVEECADSVRRTMMKKSTKNSATQNFKCDDNEMKDLVLNSPAEVVEDSQSADLTTSSIVTEVNFPGTEEEQFGENDVPVEQPADKLLTENNLHLNLDPTRHLTEDTVPSEEEPAKSRPPKLVYDNEESSDSCSLSLGDVSEGSYEYPVKEDAQAEVNCKSVDDVTSVERAVLAKYDVPLQQCYVCNKISCFTSRYCDKCGTKLYQMCSNCKECNPTFAVFCQYCGVKLCKDENNELDIS